MTPLEWPSKGPRNFSDIFEKNDGAFFLNEQYSGQYFSIQLEILFSYCHKRGRTIEIENEMKGERKKIFVLFISSFFSNIHFTAESLFFSNDGCSFPLRHPFVVFHTADLRFRSPFSLFSFSFLSASFVVIKRPRTRLRGKPFEYQK